MNLFCVFDACENIKITISTETPECYVCMQFIYLGVFLIGSLTLDDYNINF